MKDVIMYVVTHKKINVKLGKEYIPIQVGKCNTGLELPYLTDEEGDNISNKNTNYCELTALYWIWKNKRSESKYIGICHYRRLFVYGIFSKLLDEKKINKIFKKYDIILPTKGKFSGNRSIGEAFMVNSVRKDEFEKLRTIISNKYPEYINSYDDVVLGKYASLCNLMVMKEQDYIDYCEWLFDILFDLEKVTDLTGYSKKEQRVYGFLSEMLLNVWVKNNKLKIKYCAVYFESGNKIKNILNRIKAIAKNLWLT